MSIPKLIASAGVAAALTVGVSATAFAQRGHAVPPGSVRVGGGIVAGRPIAVAPFRGFFGYRAYSPFVNFSFFYGTPGFYGAYAY